VGGRQRGRGYRRLANRCQPRRRPCQNSCRSNRACCARPLPCPCPHPRPGTHPIDLGLFCRPPGACPLPPRTPPSLAAAAPAPPPGPPLCPLTGLIPNLSPISSGPAAPFGDVVRVSPFGDSNRFQH